MPHYEEKKAIIAQKVLERKQRQRQQAEEEAAPELEVEIEASDEEPLEHMEDLLNTFDLPLEIPEGEEEYNVEVDESENSGELLSLQKVFHEIFEEAYQAYCTGADFEDNPHGTREEVTEEDEDDPEFVLSEVWSDGWLSAHTDACMANLVLLAKEMVTTEDNDALVDIFDKLTEAVEVLGEVVDYDDFAKNWEDIIG